MTYRRFTYEREGWLGTLNESGWASFRGGTLRHNVSMAAVCATQEQAEAYVKAKVVSLAQGDPVNTYIPITESATGRLDVDQRPEGVRSGRAFKINDV